MNLFGTLVAHIIFTPMESTDTDLAFAIDIAKTDRREAPWYAVWNIILTQKLFNGFCKKPCSAITYPQYPLTHTVDTYDTEVTDVTEDWNDEETGQPDVRFPGGDSGPLTPVRPASGPFQAPPKRAPHSYHPGHRCPEPR